MSTYRVYVPLTRPSPVREYAEDPSPPRYSAFSAAVSRILSVEREDWYGPFWWGVIKKYNYQPGQWYYGIEFYFAEDPVVDGRKTGIFIPIRLPADAEIHEAKCYFPRASRSCYEAEWQLQLQLTCQDSASPQLFVNDYSFPLGRRDDPYYVGIYTTDFLTRPRLVLQNVVWPIFCEAGLPYQYNLWSPNFAGPLQTLVNKYSGINALVLFLECVWVPSPYDYIHLHNTAIDEESSPSLFPQALLYLKYTSAVPPPYTPSIKQTRRIFPEAVASDLTYELRDTEIRNDVRFIIPKIEWVMDETQNPPVKTPIDYHEYFTDPNSIRKYGRRTLIVNRPLIKKEAAQLSCKRLLERYKEPLGQLELKVGGNIPFQTISSEYLYPNEDIVTPSQYWTCGCGQCGTNRYKYLAAPWDATNEQRMACRWTFWGVNSNQPHRYGLTRLQYGGIVKAVIGVAYVGNSASTLSRSYWRFRLYLNGLEVDTDEKSFYGYLGPGKLEWDLTNYRPGGGQWQISDLYNLNAGVIGRIASGYSARLYDFYIRVDYVWTSDVLLTCVQLGDIFQVDLPSLYIQDTFVVDGIEMIASGAGTIGKLKLKQIPSDRFSPIASRFIIGTSEIGSSAILG